MDETIGFGAFHMANIKQSTTSTISVLATERRHQGRDVIAINTGEPDLSTPDHIRLAGIQSILEGKTKDLPILGILPLRKAICRKLKEDNILNDIPAQTIVGAGCKQVIFNALAVTLNPADKIISPASHLARYPDQVLFHIGIPAIVETASTNQGDGRFHQHA